MKLSVTTIALLLLLAALACFVCYTTQTLPTVVASHFGATGAPNGYMSRSVYMILMLLLIIGTPLVVAFLPAFVIDKNGNNLNIPNRKHWLALDQRDATITFLNMHSQWFAAALALFLAYVHWLVVQANYLQPPVLSMSAMFNGLAAFFVTLAVWLVALYRRFKLRN